MYDVLDLVRMHKPISLALLSLSQHHPAGPSLSERFVFYLMYSTPVLVTLLAYVSSAQDPILGVVYLTTYTTGFIAPLLIAATATVHPSLLFPKRKGELGSIVQGHECTTIRNVDHACEWNSFAFRRNLCSPFQNHSCLMTLPFIFDMFCNRFICDIKSYRSSKCIQTRIVQITEAVVHIETVADTKTLRTIHIRVAVILRTPFKNTTRTLATLIEIPILRTTEAGGRILGHVLGAGIIEMMEIPDSTEMTETEAVILEDMLPIGMILTVLPIGITVGQGDTKAIEVCSL